MHHVNEQDIRQYFQGYGTIDSIEIPRDHITQKPKGYALIDFRRALDAKEAVSLLNGFEIDGKKINVQIHTDYLQKTLNQKENQKTTESFGVSDENGASYIHTSQARTALMQKLMQRDPTGKAAAIPDDEGQTIRQSNFAIPKVETFIVPEVISTQPSSCILIANMFDPLSVDLNKDPHFFVEIKEQVQDVCSEWGQVDKVMVDQNSNGNVWVRYGGEKATSSSMETMRVLHGKLFDGRKLSLSYV